MKQILTALLSILMVNGATAQILTDTSEVFFLERWTTGVPRNLQHLKQQSDQCGLVWRLGTGVLLPQERNNYNAVAPLIFDAGYKWHFAEAGIRVIQGGLPLSRESLGISAISGDINYVTARPEMSVFNARMGMLTLYGHAWKMPVYMKAGLGRWRSEIRNSETIVDNVPVILPLAQTKTGRSSMLEAGFYYRYFWAGIGYLQYSWHNSQLERKDITQVTALMMGVNLCTGKGKAFDTPSMVKKGDPSRFWLEVGATVIAAPVRGGVASAPYLAAGVRLSERSDLSLHVPFWWADNGHPNEPGPARLGFRTYPELSRQNRVQLLWDIRLNKANQSVIPKLTMGIDHIRAKDIGLDDFGFGEPAYIVIPAHNAIGLAMGGAVQINYLTTRLTYHKILSDFPSFWEWKMAVRLQRWYR